MLTQHDKLIDKLERQLEVLPQRSAFYSANSIPQATRKYSGQSRANTRMEIGGIDDTVYLAPVYAPNAITGELGERKRAYERVSKRVKIGDTVHISNSLDYIQSVEFELGDLMFSKAIQKWPQHVRAAVRDAKRVQ